MLLDAYKLFHRQMYPNNTVTVYSNATARHCKHYKGPNKDYVISFGQQKLVRLLKDKFQDFFDLPHDEVMSFIKEQLTSFTGAEYAIEHLSYLHKLGYLPLVIKGLPEGSKVPFGVPYMTMYNTDPKCYWLTNYLETYMSSEIWHQVTTATIANDYRLMFEYYAMKSVGNTDFVQFQGHDFSARGDFGWEASSSIGLGHITSFVGGDTVSSYLDAQYYYDMPQNDWDNFKLVQTSVPATEHSVQCAYFNPKDGEELAYLDAILEKFPTGIVSIVCDGFDFWKFLTKVLPQRKEVILARDGKLVVRPDSGNPVHIITGEDSVETSEENVGETAFIQYSNDEFGEYISEEQHKGAIEVLWDIFGGTTTEKGYKLLDGHIGLIYGDAITYERGDQICDRLLKKGFASINWIAGIGSFTYQFNTRDSHGQAFKATYVEFNVEAEKAGENTWYNKIGKSIFKDPKTGDGSKKSAKGLLSVIKTDDKYVLLNEQNWENENKGELKVIFQDGVLHNQVTLFDIRNRIKNN